MTKKCWYINTPALNNSESGALCKQKNSEKFLTSNLAWPKKVGVWIPLPWQIQSPECSVNEKIPKNLVSPNKIGAQTPPLKNSESTVLCN